MATLWISEYGGLAANNPLVPALPAKANTAGSLSASASTAALGAGTNLIGLQSDVAAFILVGSSASTTVVTSTNGTRIPASAIPQYFGVNPFSRLTYVST